jgi:hypothetical protein
MFKRLCYAVLLCCLFSAFTSAQNGKGYDLKLLQPAGANGFTFEDESIKISFPLSTHLSFTLTNKTKTALLIDWKNASFTDVNGQPQKIIHEDVRNAAKVDAQPVSEVVANGSLTDTIVPVGFITQGDSDSWMLRRLFHGGIENYVGKQFSLRLPLKVGDQEKEYNFTFTVESAK